VLGRISIPAIGLQRYFVEGVAEAQLQEGPGRYPGSGLPGQAGNLAIAGHRTTYGAPFFELGRLVVGDAVIIATPEGQATYTVSEPPFAVSPFDVHVLDDFGDARLTLTTCNPPFFATTRLIVVAKLTKWQPTVVGAGTTSANAGKPRTAPSSGAQTTVGTKGAVAPTVVPVRASGARQPNAATAPDPGQGAAADAGADDNSTVGQGLAGEGGGWHLAKLPIVLGVVIALCALGALYDRVAVLCVGASRWLVMVPMWAAGLLALFKVLGLLLPADL
jgi:LPXTG-site transpeptidase (sortase) family protein